MRRNKRWVWLLIGIFFVSATLPLLVKASDTKIDPGARMWKSSVDYGKHLFTGKKLGTNEKSCSDASCHGDGGNLIGVMAKYPKYVKMANRVVTLGHMVNFCIFGAVKGKMLDLDSTKLIAIMSYIKSLSEEKK